MRHRQCGCTVEATTGAHILPCVNPKDAPGGDQTREIPTARSLLQAQHERVMAEGEARLKALLRRYA